MRGEKFMFNHEKSWTVEREIYDIQRTIQYDTRVLSLQEVVDKFDDNITEDKIRIALQDSLEIRRVIFVPDYQRNLIWNISQQSQFIESIILGLPISSIFAAQWRNGAWEIVDGSQRIRTISAFLKNELILSDLQTLSILNGCSFLDLDDFRREQILNTEFVFILLAEGTIPSVKADIFNRINQGSGKLTPMERRKGSDPFTFKWFIYNYCRENEQYRELTFLSSYLECRQEREELLLRFFAFTEEDFNYKITNCDVIKYLDDYFTKMNYKWERLPSAMSEKIISSYTSKIDRVNDFVHNHFPFGYSSDEGLQTSRLVFEAISVGVWKIINSQKPIKKISYSDIEKSLTSKKFKEITFNEESSPYSMDKFHERIQYIFDLFV